MRVKLNELAPEAIAAEVGITTGLVTSHFIDANPNNHPATANHDTAIDIGITAGLMVLSAGAVAIAKRLRQRKREALSEASTANLGY